MLDTKQIQDKFDSLKAFERFCLEWTRICAKLNRNGVNAERITVVEVRAERLGI